MQSQRRHEEEKDNHYPHIRKKVQGECPQFLFIQFKLFDEPRSIRVPQHQCKNPIEQREEDANAKGAQEKIPEENDFFAFHNSPLISDELI
jgi:hypothetical protein